MRAFEEEFGGRMDGLDSSPDNAEARDGIAPLGERCVVRVQDLVKHFRRNDGSVVRAVDGVSLDVRPGEFVVLLGPSGCGKTSLLRSIGGLERPDGGFVEVHGQTVYSSEHSVNVRPERRKISMVFQSYALWPHMTAFQNDAYPLLCRHVRKKEVRTRVREALALVGVADLERQHPGQMSGGQQQRIALARAIVARDDLILFDEPLSNVDAKVREQLRVELISLQRELGFAAIYVTHDQIEAMEMANRLAVMGEGKIVQMGPPAELYATPKSRYVARFIGRVNELDGRVVQRDRLVGSASVETAVGLLSASAPELEEVEDEVVVMIRPERLRIGPDQPDTPNRWEGSVRGSLFSGAHTQCFVDVGELSLSVWLAGEAPTQGARVWLSVDPNDVRILARHDDVSPLIG